MKTSTRKLMDLRLPYIKLIIVMGVITWIKDYKKIEEASQFLQLGEKCHTLKNLMNNPESVTCSFPIFQNNQVNQATYEK